jgi:hypothetical protein
MRYLWVRLLFKSTCANISLRTGAETGSAKKGTGSTTNQDQYHKDYKDTNLVFMTKMLIFFTEYNIFTTCHFNAMYLVQFVFAVLY